MGTSKESLLKGARPAARGELERATVSAILGATGALRGGHRKRCDEQRELNLKQKAAEDLAKIDNLPSWQEMQVAVKRGYVCLKGIARRWSGALSLPRAARGAANCILAGAIALDAFLLWASM